MKYFLILALTTVVINAGEFLLDASVTLKLTYRAIMVSISYRTLLLNLYFIGYIKNRGPLKALPGIHARIVGGEDAKRGEFPFIVSWQSSSGFNRDILTFCHKFSKFGY